MSACWSVQQKAQDLFYQAFLEDRIYDLYDSLKVDSRSRRVGSPIVQYYSPVDNTAIARDEKLRAFYRIYDNCISVQNDEELKEFLKDFTPRDVSTDSSALEPVLAFGQRAHHWASSYCSI